jgi:hypothetical protein
MTDPLLTFPQNGEDPAQWTAMLRTSRIPAEKLLAYVYGLYARERLMGTRYHQLLVAMTYLAEGYESTAPANERCNVYKCAECQQSVIVDGTDTGRILACGHVMHSFCMASFCTANDTVAPGCPKCGVRFSPPNPDPAVQLHYCELLTAARVFSVAPEERAAEVQRIFVDYTANKTELTSASPVIERLILTDTQNVELIETTAREVCLRERTRLTRLAQEVARQLIPTLDGPFPFPVLPRAEASAAPAATAAPATPAYVAETRAPARFEAAMPQDLEPDVLLPEGATLEKTRVNNHVVMSSKFAGKCKRCKRPQVPGRTVISADDNGFACSICVLKMRSRDVWDVVTCKTELDASDLCS